MRGIKGMMWEGSLLDAEEVRRFLTSEQTVI
jgi:hypothetical protein